MYEGLVHRGQFPALGVTRADLRARLGYGAWRQVLPDVYATFDGYLSGRHRCIAACLYAGEGSVVSGRAGDEIYLAFRNIGGSGLLNHHDRLFLQFRKGRLTGWKADWGHNWMWQ